MKVKDGYGGREDGDWRAMGGMVIEGQWGGW